MGVGVGAGAHLPDMSKHYAASTPAYIPTVTLSVQDDGTVIVTMEGNLLPPPANTVWRRSSLPEIIDLATKERTIPVWVEVRETDGSSFTDLIPARPVPPRSKEASEETVESRPRHATQRAYRSELCEVRAEGFIPGEDVAIAPITGYTDATADGIARALIDSAEHPYVSEVVLVGRISGAMAIRNLE